MTSKRQSNIELLRILAMLMIIGHHLCVHGVMHYTTDEQFQVWTTGSQINKWFSSFLFPGGEVGVAIFFIITGYFCINKDFVSPLKVTGQTCFYGILGIIIFIPLKASHIAFDDLAFFSVIQSSVKCILLPATGGYYWFVTSYIILCLLIPTINHYLNKLNAQSFFRILILYWVLWYSIASFFSVPFFNIQKGVFFIR